MGLPIDGPHSQCALLKRPFLLVLGITTLGAVWVRQAMCCFPRGPGCWRGCLLRHARLGRLFTLGDLLTAFCVAACLVLLHTGVAALPVLGTALQPDALTAAGLGGGQAGRGSQQPTAHLVGEGTAAQADEAGAGQTGTGQAAAAAARQAGLALALQSAWCCGWGQSAGSLDSWESLWSPAGLFGCWAWGC